MLLHDSFCGASGCLQSNHDEADTRLALHAADALKSKEIVVIHSVDTDVLIIALHHFRFIAAEQSEKGLVMLLGTGVHKRFSSIFELKKNMPTRVLHNTLSMQALTGGDSVSSLF